jgi:DNA-binding transcriptional MerR regulator
MQAQPLIDTSTPGRQENFTISQVARLAGINAKAIRYYESIGLLPPPERRSNQYRRYSLADVNRLILLRRIRYLGVPLAEAKALLQGATEAPRSQVQQDLLHLLRQDLEQYQQKLASCHPDEQEPFCVSVDLSCIAVDDKGVCQE